MSFNDQACITVAILGEGNTLMRKNLFGRAVFLTGCGIDHP